MTGFWGVTLFSNQNGPNKPESVHCVANDTVYLKIDELGAVALTGRHPVSNG